MKKTLAAFKLGRSIRVPPAKERCVQCTVQDSEDELVEVVMVKVNYEVNYEDTRTHDRVRQLLEYTAEKQAECAADALSLTGYPAKNNMYPSCFEDLRETESILHEVVYEIKQETYQMCVDTSNAMAKAVPTLWGGTFLDCALCQPSATALRHLAVEQSEANLARMKSMEFSPSNPENIQFLLL